MKILLVTRLFSKNEGVAKCVVELAERLVDGHEVYLLTSDYEYRVKGLEKVYEISVIQTPFFLQVLNFALMAKYYIPKVQKEHNIKIVNTQKTEAFGGNIVTMHSCHKAAIKENNRISKQNLPYWKYSFYKLLRSLWLLNIVRLFIEKRILEVEAEKVISVSRGVKREIIANYGISEEKIEAIQNGVDVARFTPNEKAKKKIRKKYDIRNTDIVGFFCSHEFRRKGLEYVIKALPQVKKDIKILMAGKDAFAPYKKLASNLGVKGRLIYVGNITENIENYYAAADLFLFPTKYEAFSLATLEAAASGLPLITTRVNGTEELVKEGNNGYFVEREASDISQKINMILGDPSLLNEMKNNARNIAENYSWEKVAERTVKVYEDFLKN